MWLVFTRSLTAQRQWWSGISGQLQFHSIDAMLQYHTHMMDVAAIYLIKFILHIPNLSADKQCCLLVKLRTHFDPV